MHSVLRQLWWLSLLFLTTSLIPLSHGSSTASSAAVIKLNTATHRKTNTDTDTKVHADTLLTLVRNTIDPDGLTLLATSSLALMGVNYLPVLPYDTLGDLGMRIAVYDLDTETGSLTPSAQGQHSQAPSVDGMERDDLDNDFTLSEDMILLSNEVVLRGDLLDVIAHLRPEQHLVLVSSPGDPVKGEDQMNDGDAGKDNYEVLVDFFVSLQQLRHISRLRVGSILSSKRDDRQVDAEHDRGEGGGESSSSSSSSSTVRDGTSFTSPVLDTLLCEAMTLGVLNVHSPHFFPTDTHLLFTHPDDALLSLASLLSSPLSPSSSPPSTFVFKKYLSFHSDRDRRDVTAHSLCVRTAFVFNQLAAYSAAPVYFHHPPLGSMPPADQQMIQNNIHFGEDACQSSCHSSVVTPWDSDAGRHTQRIFSNNTVDELLQASVRRYLTDTLQVCSPSMVSELKLQQEHQWIQQKVKSLVEQQYQVILFHTDTTRSTVNKMHTLSSALQGWTSSQHLPQQYPLSSDSCQLFANCSPLAAEVVVVAAGIEVNREEVEAALLCSLRNQSNHYSQSNRRSQLNDLTTSTRINSLVLMLWGENIPQALVNVVGPVPPPAVLGESHSQTAARFAMENIQQRHRPFVSHNLSVHNDEREKVTHSSPLVFKIQKGKKEPSSKSQRVDTARAATATATAGGTRSRTILLTHMRNEELLLPQWIRHNAPHFDMAILLDYNSSDASLDIIRSQAPSTWSVVQSKYAQFECKEADEELMEIERRFPQDWKLVLTLTEFLVLPSLRHTLLQSHLVDTTLLRFPSYLMVGEATEVEAYHSHQSLLLQRRHFGIDPLIPKAWLGLTIYSRFMHRKLSARTHYGSGRHFMHHDGQLLTDEDVVEIAKNPHDDSGIVFKSMRDNGFITKYKWTPWPETIPRNAQIYPRISQHDRQVGTPHVYNGGAALTARRVEIFKHWFIENFKSVGIRADRLSDLRLQTHRIWLETTQQAPLFYDNLHFLKNVSDTFELSIKINNEDEVIQLRMSDLLLASSSSTSSSEDSLYRATGRFCREHVRAGDDAVASCQRSVATFAYHWVMKADLY